MALKVLKSDKRGSHVAVRGLKREIMLLSLMHHPGVMSTIALGQHESHPFMVMPRREWPADSRARGRPSVG